MLRLVLIRYNLMVPYVKASERRHLDPIWLEERKTLYERYCWPSLQKQTDSDFKVLILFDAATQQDYIQSLAQDERVTPMQIESDYRAAGITFREGILKAVAVYLKNLPAEMSGHLVTIRLDNDDALAPNYMSTLREGLLRFPPGANERYYYFSTGQDLDPRTGEYRLLRYPANAFGALAEPMTKAPRTVMNWQHTELHKLPGAVELDAHIPYWMRVIHGGNVLNTMKGKVMAEPHFQV